LRGLQAFSPPIRYSVSPAHPRRATGGSVGFAQINNAPLIHISAVACERSLVHTSMGIFFPHHIRTPAQNGRTLWHKRTAIRTFPQFPPYFVAQLWSPGPNRGGTLPLRVRQRCGGQWRMIAPATFPHNAFEVWPPGRRERRCGLIAGHRPAMGKARAAGCVPDSRPGMVSGYAPSFLRPRASVLLSSPRNQIRITCSYLRSGHIRHASGNQRPAAFNKVLNGMLFT